MPNTNHKELMIYLVCSITIFFYFIPSSEFNAYLMQIKVILSTVKKYRIFSRVTNTIFIFFTVVNSSCFDNLGLIFVPKRPGACFTKHLKPKIFLSAI